MEIRRLNGIFVRIFLFPAETQRRRDLCGNLKCEGWTQGAEQMHVTPKGRRAAEDAADAEACVVGSVITLPLVVALVIALSFEAIRQLPSASVFAHKKAKTRSCCTRWKSMEKRLPVALRAAARFKSAKKGRRDAADEIRRETIRRENSL